jgi:hypothetical protein
MPKYARDMIEEYTQSDEQFRVIREAVLAKSK